MAQFMRVHNFLKESCYKFDTCHSGGLFVVASACDSKFPD